MKKWWDSLIVAFQFLTRIPIPVQVTYDVRSVSRSVLFFPAVGLTIGLLVSCAAWLLPAEAAPLNAALLLLLWTVLTGGLHLDGWMDTMDGLGSHRNREQMLTIMKDSRVGAMGVLAALFLLIIKWASLWILLIRLEASMFSTSTLFFMLLSIPTVSRWWMAAAIVRWPYIGGERGMGSLFQKASSSTLIGAFCITVLPLFLTPSLPWVGVTAAQMLTGWLLIRYFVHRLGGLTGDTYGAVNEVVEAVGLIVSVYISL